MVETHASRFAKTFVMVATLKITLPLEAYHGLFYFELAIL
jgi:hypothetical protein